MAQGNNHCFCEIYTLQRNQDDAFVSVKQVGKNIRQALNCPLDIIIFINIKVDGVLDICYKCRPVE